jgi:flagellar basal-body rod protein FlgB
MINRLTDALDFQARALVLRAERQRVLASNIANADTPGYVARDFDFAAALREASQAPQAKRLGGAIAGRGFEESLTAAAQATALRYAAPSQTNLDGNSVDMDRERAAFADNAVKYESTLRFINGSVRTLIDAMKSHNQG